MMAERTLDIEELATMLNMTTEEVQELISEPEPPTEELLRRLSLALAVDVPWLRGETLTPLFYLDNEEYAVIKGYRRASDDTQRAVRAILTMN